MSSIEISSSDVFEVLSYSVGGFPITSVSSHKDLGVTVQSNLSWSLPYDNICYRAYP